MHQASLYALDGYRVVASDFPATLSLPPVMTFAAADGIELLPYENLESGQAFAGMPDDSIDLLLFTEIIEHITFNPLKMWREFLSSFESRRSDSDHDPELLSLRRALSRPREIAATDGRRDNGDEIIRTNTYGHHWKEYSLNELIRYFRLLSPDFVLHKAHRVRNYYPNRPRLLRPFASSKALCRTFAPTSTSKSL